MASAVIRRLMLLSLDVYVIVIHSLSSFGFFITFLTLYLLFTVPTKLTTISRFIIHGHDLTSAIAQLYFTLGFIPHVILPCASGYTNGLFTYFNVMGTLDQLWIQVILIAINGSFSLLLTINRALAVSLKVSEKWKSLILKLFFLLVAFEIIFLIIAGMNMKGGGEKGRQLCAEKLPYEYPQEMYTRNGVDVIPSESLGFILVLTYMGTFTTFYLTVAVVCVTILIRSIRDQGKSSQSTQFLANQRRITIGIIYFLLVELLGLGIPIIMFSVCLIFSMGTQALSQYATISICFYPIFGPYYVLMSNADYRKKMNSVVRKAFRISSIHDMFTAR